MNLLRHSRRLFRLPHAPLNIAVTTRPRTHPFIRRLSHAPALFSRWVPVRALSSSPDVPVLTQEAVRDFTVEQVCAWASEIDGVRPVHARNLASQEIDGQQLLKVTKEELERSGIPLGPAGKIMDALGVIKGHDGDVLFTFSTGTLDVLRSPIAEWKEWDVIDVGDMNKVVADAGFHERLFLRKDSLRLLREWDCDSPYMIVYGTPGIGKSALAQLAVARHLALGDPVVFHYRGATWLLRYDETRGKLHKEEMRHLDGLGFNQRPERGECVMVFDSPEGFQSLFGLVGPFKKVLIVHSPSGNLNNSRKAVGASYVAYHLLPPPDMDEICEAGERLGIFKGGSLNRRQVEDRVVKYGPIIRFAFSLNEAMVQEWVSAGIEKMVGAGIENVLNVHAADRLAHGVMLMRKDSSGRNLYSFASDYIRDSVCDALANGDVSRLLKLANCPDLHGSLRGAIFENRMLDYLRTPSVLQFKRAVETNVADEFDVRIIGESVAFSRRAPLPTTLKTGICYRPESKTNEAWDAFVIVPNGELCVLQFTVAKEHAVTRKGIKACLDMVQERGIEDADGNVIRHANDKIPMKSRLVFVVPPCLFPTFKLPQKVATQAGDATVQPLVDGQEKWQIVQCGEARVPWNDRH